MIKKMNWFVKLITLGWPRAISLAPFGIYIQEEWLNNKILRNHEKIHWDQQKEIWYIGFYLWYPIEWIIKIPTGHPYKNLSFEREANAHEHEMGYLEIRKRFAWTKYLTK